jgi:hypothetical protein
LLTGVAVDIEEGVQRAWAEHYRQAEQVSAGKRRAKVRLRRGIAGALGGSSYEGICASRI